MQHLRRHLISLSLLAAVALAAGAEERASKDTAGAGSHRLTPEQVAADVLSSMDRDADPCQDFYRYACGGWLDANPLPADQTRWARSFSTIHERNRKILRQILERAAAAPGEDPDRRRIGLFYGSCMDQAKVDAAGVKPLAAPLAEIAEVRDPATFMAAVGKLHRRAVDALFGVAVLVDFKDPGVYTAFYLQGGLGMPDRDYYVSEDPKKQELLKKYEQHVARMLGMLGEEPARAAADAAAIVAFETRLAAASRTRAQMRVRDKLYNKVDVAGLQKLTPHLPWDVYHRTIGYPELNDVSVATPEFFEAIDPLVADSPPELLRAYLRWRLISDTAEALSSDVVQADFEFFDQQLGGQQELEPRWKQCVAATEDALGEALGKLYVEEQFAGPSKDVALEMIHDIEKAFEGALPTLSWMDEATAKRAVEKAQRLANKIGYPDAWRDYSSMRLAPGDYFANVMAGRAYDFDRNARKVGNTVDRKEWGMTPQQVNAYYNPQLNEIVFPAGILQPPFFHRDFPAAMNYGAVGAVMGHELSHGFDDQGRKFAPDGQMREWWEPAASERFTQQAQCIVDQYGRYEIEPGAAVNGALTLGENIADVGGVKQAYAAYKSWEARHGKPAPFVDGLSNEQLFFVAYAQVWCSQTTPEQARVQLTTNPHSPPQFRVLGPVSNNATFATAFACEPGEPMRPEKVCEVW